VTDLGKNKGFRILDKMAAKALDDDDYRRKLLAEPSAVLSAEGLKLPEGVDIVVVENTATRIHLVLPSQLPAAGGLDADDVELKKIIPFNKF
jgi:hypothetical protein